MNPSTLDEEEIPEKKSLWQIILGIILISLLLLFILPTNSLSPHPRPKNIPSLEEVIPKELSLPSEKRQTLSVAIDPAIKLVAARITSRACSKADARCSAESLFMFVRDEITYITDPITEYYEDPKETLLAGGADCDGQAMLLASLLVHSGVQARFAFSPQHVYVEAWVPKRTLFRDDTWEWLSLDPTCTTCLPGEHG